MDSKKITPSTFRDDLNSHLFPTIAGAPDRISKKTARRWLKFLGYFPGVHKKSHYVDGHQRVDVVAHRDGCFFAEDG